MTQKIPFRVLILCILLLGVLVLGCSDPLGGGGGEDAVKRIRVTREAEKRIEIEITMTANVKGE